MRYEICGRVIGNTIKGVLSTSNSYYISHLNPYYGNTRVWFELTFEWTRITSYKGTNTKNILISIIMVPGLGNDITM